MLIDENFFAWRRKAERRGLGHTAIKHYYADDADNLFTARINGSEHTYPVFLSPAWNNPHDDMDAILEPLASNPYTHRDERGIHLRTAALAYLNDDPNPSPEDYVFNGDMIYARVEDHRGTASPVESDYYTKLSIEGQLLDELYRAIYRRDPDATPDTVHEIVDDLKLPTRAKHAKSFDHMLKRPLSTGSTLLVVVNTGDDYQVLFAKRSTNLLESPGWWSLAPSGTFQMQDGNELSLEDQHLREYSEELFDDSVDLRPLDCSEVTALRDLLDAGDAHLDHLGMSIECRRAHLEFNGLLFIDSPEYFEQHIAENISTSREHDRFEFISVDEGDRLGQCIKAIKPYHVPCAVAGLRRLEDEYGINVATDLDIVNP